MFLDAGGELASLEDGDELSHGALEHALEEQNELTFDVLAKRIDKTGQLDDKQRDELDDMPAGEEQTLRERQLELVLYDGPVSLPQLDAHFSLTGFSALRLDWVSTIA